MKNYLQWIIDRGQLENREGKECVREERVRLNGDAKRNKRIDWTDRANGAPTSEIMDRNYPGPNPLAFDGVRHSGGIVFPSANRARSPNVSSKHFPEIYPAGNSKFSYYIKLIVLLYIAIWRYSLQTLLLPALKIKSKLKTIKICGKKVTYKYVCILFSLWIGFRYLVGNITYMCSLEIFCMYKHHSTIGLRSNNSACRSTITRKIK